MTNQEIDQLKPGRELDALIAEKVMGEKPPFAYADPGAKGGHGDPGGYRLGARPYSTDIAAAWKVVGKLCERTYDRDIHIEHLHDEWAVSTCHDVSRGGWDDFTRAETAPLAICRAALKAVGSSSPILSRPAVEKAFATVSVIESNLTEEAAQGVLANARRMADGEC